MPESDIEGPLYDCWAETRRIVREGVSLIVSANKSGGITVKNNLPKASDEDGTEIGEIKKNSSELPDGRWMTKQSFWLNKRYVQEIGDPLLEQGR